MPEKDFDVEKLARLSRIALTPEEVELYQKQVSKVLSYMRKIDEVDVSDIEPTAHAAAVFNVMREDVPGETLEREDALRNAPHEALDQFAVTVVVES